MEPLNPFEPPPAGAELQLAAPHEVDIELVRVRHKLLIGILLANVTTLVARFMDVPGHWFLTLATFVFSVFGVIVAGSALRVSVFTRVLMALAQLLPWIGLFVLFALSQKASALLTDAGYRVGFFGAAK